MALGLERMAQLMNLCNRFMLRRTSAVLKSLLPTKVEQVVFCKLSPLQAKLYRAFLDSQPVRALLASATTAAAAAAADAADGGGDGERGAAAAAAAPMKRRKSLKQGAQGQPAANTDSSSSADHLAAVQQPIGAAAPLGDSLAPLVAITALKKLCCHPDLIHDMLHKQKVRMWLRLINFFPRHSAHPAEAQNI